MSQRKARLWVLGFPVALTVAATLLQAQTSKPPQAYSLTAIVPGVVEGKTMTDKIYRDGSKVLVDSRSGATAEMPKGLHTRLLINYQTHTGYTWDLIDTSSPCQRNAIPGDWGDPFRTLAEVDAENGVQNPKMIGTETVNGFPTKVFEASDAGEKTRGKIWVDEKYGSIIKIQMIPEGGPAQTLMEVKQLSLAKPPASLFVAPAACANAPQQ